MISGDLLTIPELQYMLVGEKLAQGSKLYTDVWVNIGPLSSWTYGVLSYIFGRSQVAFGLVSLLIVFFQSYLFNRLLLRNKAYNENTYIPGLIYAILMSYFFDFFSLSPTLMGITFILLALEQIFSHVEVRAKRDENILSIGIYLGIASLFYLPFVTFLLATLLIFLLFTGTIPRRYLLVLFGFSLPFLLTGCYFLIAGRFGDLVYNFVLSSFFQKVWYFTSVSTLTLFAIPLVLFIVALVTFSQRARMTNYQTRISQSVFLWLVFSVIFILLSDTHSPNLYLIFVPIISYYLAHYFLVFRRKFLAEVIFSLLLSIVLLVNNGVYFKWYKLDQLIDLNSYIVKQDDADEIRDKHILVLGENLAYYYHNTMATPFLSWKLSKRTFRDTNYYDNLTVILNGFKNDMPQVIIDQHNIMPDVLNKIPFLKKNYIQQSRTVYVLNN